jgi:hypothetical protein
MNLLNNWREKTFVFSLIYIAEKGGDYLCRFFPRDDFYFAGCATVVLLMLIVVWSLPRTVLTRDVSRLVFVQFFLQWIGWVLYAASSNGHFYSLSIHAIVIVTYLRILLDGLYERAYTNRPGWMLFHPDR